jgi:hypothetical protein
MYHPYIPKPMCHYTIMCKCCHTLFSSVLLHYSILMWIYSYESSLNSKHAMPSIRFYHYMVILEDQSFPIIWPSHPNFQSLSCKPSFKPCLSHHTNHKKFKMLNQPISIVCIAWSYLSWTSVFMIVNFYCYRLKGENVSCWEKWRVWTPKRQVTHILLPTFTTALVIFSSMHDRWNVQLFYKMLRS